PPQRAITRIGPLWKRDGNSSVFWASTPQVANRENWPTVPKSAGNQGFFHLAKSIWPAVVGCPSTSRLEQNLERIRPADLANARDGRDYWRRWPWQVALLFTPFTSMLTVCHTMLEIRGLDLAADQLAADRRVVLVFPVIKFPVGRQRAAIDPSS